MEENYKELLLQIIIILRRKYNCMSEIFRLTDEAAQALGRDDKVSAQMLLGMRGEELDKVRECERDLCIFKESMFPELQQWFESALTGVQPVEEAPYGAESAMVLKISANIRSIWEKIMVLDRRMNMRLAGKDSFYAGE